MPFCVGTVHPTPYSILRWPSQGTHPMRLVKSLDWVSGVAGGRGPRATELLGLEHFSTKKTDCTYPQSSLTKVDTNKVLPARCGKPYFSFATNKFCQDYILWRQQRKAGQPAEVSKDEIRSYFFLLWLSSLSSFGRRARDSVSRLNPHIQWWTHSLSHPSCPE